MSLNRRQRALIESGATHLGAGETFYVTPGATFSADFTNSFKGAGTVVNKLGDAIGLVTAGRGDEIVLMPGMHTVDGNISLAKANCTVRGFLPGAPNSTIVVGDGDAGRSFLTLAADQCVVKDLTFVTAHASDDCLTITGNYCTVLDSNFLAADAAGDGVVIDVTAAGGDDAASNTIKGCRFQGLTRSVVALGDADGGTVESLTIEDCLFLKGVSSYIISSGLIANSVPGLTSLVIKDCDFHLDGSTPTTVINLVNTGTGDIACTGIMTGCSVSTATAVTADFVGINGSSGMMWQDCRGGTTAVAFIAKP